MCAHAATRLGVFHLIPRNDKRLGEDFHSIYLARVAFSHLHERGQSFKSSVALTKRLQHVHINVDLQRTWKTLPYEPRPITLSSSNDSRDTICQ